MTLNDDIEKITKYDIEELIDFISSKKIKKETLEEKIMNSSLSIEIKRKNLQKIKIANDRIIEPLELSLKFFYLFVPFGIVNSFLDAHEQEFKKFVKFRFLKKIKQYYLFSFIGSITYIVIGIILYLLF